ncbi:hypothetical protein FRX31_002587 [Thalictrum thalictroides]|uniref:Uncharacterized protein n=1 Tax=Thalictrum thalictroides TaxID=46969 RepID=A0A7J6XGQ5_THATH|nr:hypothetical protein FRX31_002587 [Thalictrum thalictroides]
MAGCGSVVIDGVNHDFVAADKRHSRCVEIYSILNILKRNMMKPDADIFSDFVDCEMHNAASYLIEDLVQCSFILSYHGSNFHLISHGNCSFSQQVVLY